MKRTVRVKQRQGHAPRDPMAPIVRRLQCGDITALTEIMAEFRPRLSVVLNRMLQDDELTQDIIQETFIKVHQHVHGFNFQHQFSTWIFTIALNLGRNHLRRHKNITLEPLENHTRTLHSPDHDPVTHVSRLFLNGHLARGLKQMPKKYRTAFLMVDRDGKGYAEACVLLGIPLGTVKSRVNRARHFLQDYLTVNCPELLEHFQIVPTQKPPNRRKI